MTILLVAITTWSSAFPVISFGLEYFTPGELSFLRFLIASVCFLVLIAMRVIRLPPRRDWPAIALLGAIGIAAYQLLLGYAMTRVAAGAASILIALSPAVTSALAAWRLGERISTRMLIGLIVAFAGAVSVSLGSGSEFRFEPMALLIFGSVLATSIYFVWQKPLLARTSSLSFTAASIIAGTIVLAPFGLELPSKLISAPADQLAAVAWLGLAPSFIGYLLWNLALSRAPASRVSMFLYLQPVISTGIAWFWLRQVPLPATVIGGVILLFGVVLGNSKPRASSE